MTYTLTEHEVLEALNFIQEIQDADIKALADSITTNHDVHDSRLHTPDAVTHLHPLNFDHIHTISK